MTPTGASAWMWCTPSFCLPGRMLFGRLLRGVDDRVRELVAVGPERRRRRARARRVSPSDGRDVRVGRVELQAVDVDVRVARRDDDQVVEDVLVRREKHVVAPPLLAWRRGTACSGRRRAGRAGTPPPSWLDCTCEHHRGLARVQDEVVLRGDGLEVALAVEVEGVVGSGQRGRDVRGPGAPRPRRGSTRSPGSRRCRRRRR